MVNLNRNGCYAGYDPVKHKVTHYEVVFLDPHVMAIRRIPARSIQKYVSGELISEDLREIENPEARSLFAKKRSNKTWKYGRMSLNGWKRTEIRYKLSRRRLRQVHIPKSEIIDSRLHKSNTRDIMTGVKAKSLQGYIDKNKYWRNIQDAIEEAENALKLPIQTRLETFGYEYSKNVKNSYKASQSKRKKLVAEIQQLKTLNYKVNRRGRPRKRKEIDENSSSRLGVTHLKPFLLTDVVVLSEMVNIICTLGNIDKMEEN
ncbi:hypothetical protein ACTXT7_005622 [Hymenolepis weldensis]